MLIALIVTVISLPFEIAYCIKWFIAYVAIRIHNATHQRRFNLYAANAQNDPEKVGFLVPQAEIDLESPQSESHLQECSDEVLFYGINSKAECLLVRVTRGCNLESEAWIYLKLADGTTYHLAEHASYQRPFEDECLTFSCGKLQMHYLLPMRRWRIQYCGPLLQKSECQKSEEVVFVKFDFLWSASSDAYDSTLDTNTSGFASAIARSRWKSTFIPPVNEVKKAMDFYLQTGNIRGTVSVNEEPDFEMYLFGEKMRNLGNSAIVAGCTFENLLGYDPMGGYGFHMIKVSVPNLFKDLQVGFIVNPNGDVNEIKEVDMKIKPFCAVTSKREFQAKFSTDMLFEVCGCISPDPVILHNEQGWSGSVELHFATFTFQNKIGYGLILNGECSNDSTKPKSTVVKTLFPKVIPLSVKFSDEFSHFGDISGGKGSSLGKLTELSRRDKSFTVPQGIIVTTSAYQDFLTPSILRAIKQLEDVAYGNTVGFVKDECEAVAKNILNTALHNKISHSIIDNLKSIFGDGFRNQKFAVRSSATGEDTDVMSAAGQMDTFLGVQGLQEIFYAVKQCWASQFSFTAVEYKRQNGQVFNSPMAVVIQEMVACDVAGVIFTCDPVNNNPGVITVTANFGIGETVVSGSVEPDTVMLERKSNGNLQIKSINVGTKHQKIVLKESGGTIVEDLPTDSQEVTCISEDTAISLGKIAIRVERFYHSPRDVEWGIQQDKIFLFQSRPVTSGDALTEFQLKHEFDGVLRSERDYLTVANLGEVMPGAASPLGAELITKHFSNALAKQAFDKGQADLFVKSKYYESAMRTFYNQIMVSVPELICRFGHDTISSKGLTISIFGRLLEDPELLEITRERLPDSPKGTIWSDIMHIKELFFYDSRAESLKKRIHNYEMSYLKRKTAEEAFDDLMKSCTDFSDTAIYHMQCSENCSHWNIIIFWILVQAKGRFDTDVYSDFSRILATTSNLESGDVPSTVQKIANQIEKDVGAEKFKSMSLEEAENWLNTSKTSTSDVYHQFITRHHHRCLKEFDIYSIPWGQDQKIFIKLLQTLVGCSKKAAEKSHVNYSKIFSELKVPLSILSKILLRFTIPNCLKGVQSREASKSIIIKGMDNWRKGFRHLSNLMVAEGRIPDKDLLFFMPLDEIRDLLKTRNPKIIARANQRKKLFPVLDQYKFPEIMRGFPKPVNEVEESVDEMEYPADLTMHGIPVSQGIARGYARVAVSLTEASLLKPGEILIAYSTDIGWTPYFPIISGVVTELGGLISHGAVVSREYGLPCVVGLRGATKQFKTGDYVLIDGKKGSLKRLTKPQNLGDYQ